MKYHFNTQKGFTVIEILVVIGILLILLGITLGALSSQKNSATAERDAQNVLTYLEKARNQTLSSIDNSSYGVIFTSTSTRLFKGTSYSAPNLLSTYEYTSGVTSTIALSGGATQLYFNRLSGEPSATGTITFQSETIIIRATGLAEIQ